MSDLPPDQVRLKLKRYQFRYLHFVRVALLLVIACGLRHLAQTRNAQANVQAIWSSLQPAFVQQWLSHADSIKPPSDSDGVAEVRDSDQRVLGYLTLTLPQASRIVGYRGPSNSLIVLDRDQRVIAVSLLDSRDTPDHVKHVQADSHFFNQFEGWSWQQAHASIDGVSGATLTSLAIAESVVVRLGGDRPNLRFPQPIVLEELRPIFPAVASMQPLGQRLVAQDGDDRPLGWVMRTSQWVDSVEGYQGPSDILLAWSMDDRLREARLRSSFDNEPYVDYVRTERSFWRHLVGLSLNQLADFDHQQERIEGVSGATMTSVTVVDTIVQACQQMLQSEDAVAREAVWWQRWNWRDVGTVLVVLIAIYISRSKFRGSDVVKVVWALVLVAYLGLWTGNLVSQSLYYSWITGGIPWRLAPALVALGVISLLWPATTKENLYCNHLCPHGAAQRLVRGRWTNWSLPARLSRTLRWLPGLSLVSLFCAVLCDWELNLAWIEPFDAYLYPIASAASLVLAIASLVVAAKVPMAYCRYGCPTGRLLEIVRRSKRSAYWVWQDAVLVTAAAIVVMLAI